VRSVSAAFGVATFLLSAGGAMAATTSCITVAACVFGANTSTGYGVEGTSKGNDGVVGMTTENATSASAGKAGVAGYDSGTNNGTYNSGVYGTSKNGYGVQGKATGTGYGMYGTSASSVGVLGTGHNVGVEGNSLTEAGTGVSAESGGGRALDAYSPRGTGLSTTATAGTAIYASTESGKVFVGHYDGVSGSAQDVVSIDHYGNEILAGGLTMGGTPLLRTNSTTGKDLTSYGARTSSPTLEDFGQGSLRQGAAHIPLEPAYSSTIDPRSYLVFITPQGDSRGLYTTAITSTGFDVRENGGGRSSLAFSYRIVGRPLDTKAQRLPLMAKPVVQSARRLPAAPVTR
jgi:hypothetical protein